MALAALAVGAIVAVLGVSAAVDSYQHDQEIRDYAHARSTAVYFVENGDTISPSMVRLQELDDTDLGLMHDTLAASRAGNISRFNDLVAQANTTNDEQQSLQNQIDDFKDGFDRNDGR